MRLSIADLLYFVTVVEAKISSNYFYIFRICEDRPKYTCYEIWVIFYNCVFLLL